MKRHGMKYLKYFMVKTFLTAVILVRWPVKWNRLKRAKTRHRLVYNTHTKKIVENGKMKKMVKYEKWQPKFWHISIGVYSKFNSLIFHKYCVQLKNHYNKSILSSQRNMIFMLQYYTFHKSQYSAKRNNNNIIVYDVILEWNGKEECFFFIRLIHVMYI